MHQKSDGELLQGCRDGNRQAWEQLIQQYERLVYSIPLNYGLSVDDAADIAQITFTIFMQSVDTLADDSRLGSWLATVAKRHSWRLIERRRREHVQESEDLLESATLLADPKSKRPLERWENIEWLERGLAQLDDRCEQLLLALYFAPEQPSYAEVAAELGLAVGSIGATRARCLQRLKELLTENGSAQTEN